jgi:hypothetical protein
MGALSFLTSLKNEVIGESGKYERAPLFLNKIFSIFKNKLRFQDDCVGIQKVTV